MTNEITKAVEILQRGGLVAFPTETVYGLGADAANPSAVAKIFAAKNRPIDHPLIVHIAEIKQLSYWARDVSATALKLANSFWPGPLTMIFKKALHVSDLVTGSQDTIGLRIPNHPVAFNLLKSFGGALAAPSANRFGRISPTTAEAVKEELGDNVDAILAGGQCEVGVESTILDVSGETPVILRPGMITLKQIEAVLQQPVLVQRKNSPRVSGSHTSHYAPITTTNLVKDLRMLSQYLSQDCLPCAVLALNPELFSYLSNEAQLIEMPKNPKEYAFRLYQLLRDLDKQGLKRIFIEMVPNEHEWDAIRDRLRRAAVG